MTLLLTNDDVEALLPMADCVAALETAYIELAAGRAVSPSRTDALVPGAQAEQVYTLRTMSAVAPHLGVGAVRITSTILSWPEQRGARRRVKIPATKDERYVGLVLLFSTETGETLAILPDGVMQLLRVAATSGIAMKHLARADAETLGLIGCGHQAETQLLAAAAVRGLRRVQCFSPTRERRAAFAAKMRERTGCDVVAVDYAEDAAKGADVIMCATNTLTPVFEAAWLGPGLHFSAIRWHEISADVIKSADRTFIHSHDSDPTPVRTAGLTCPDDSDRRGGSLTAGLNVDALPTLLDLLGRRVDGRNSPHQVTCFVNNHGLGYQFAVLGGIAYKRACEQRRGQELPSAWFTEDVPP
jgi:ornithine cyclodeaminase/alanine dehydrogenase-like protein (mu-crystallin family)